MAKKCGSCQKVAGTEHVCKYCGTVVCTSCKCRAVGNKCPNCGKSSAFVQVGGAMDRLRHEDDDED